MHHRREDVDDPDYLPSALALGIDPLQDQQLGGLVMWIPAGLAYVVAGLALALRWAGLRASDRSDAELRAAA